MKLECDEKGDFLLEPDLLAARFAISAGELRRRMRLGLVTSLVETGTDVDEGFQRLTVRFGNTIWRAIIDSDRNVLSEETINLKQLAPESSPAASAVSDPSGSGA